MRRSTETEFLANPVGRYVAGRSFLAWCTGPSLCGGVAWGSPSVSETRQMIRLHAIFDSPSVRIPMDNVMDARGLKNIGAETYQLYFEQVAPKVPHYRRVIRRQALLLPGGMLASTFIGFYSLVGPIFPRHRVFSDAAGVARWLGSDARQALDEVATVIASRTASSEVIEGLRQYLGSHHADATLESSGRWLGASTRTLQRQLAAAGSSFRDEINHARLAAARGLLRSSTDKLEQIAEKIGFRSAAHFCAWFRRQTGQPPGHFRRTPG